MTEEGPLAYCRAVLLPIWHRWTDGHQSMLRALDCASADPRSHHERREALMAVVSRLMAREGPVGAAAAALAGMAVLATLEGETGSGYARMCRRAAEANGEALDRAAWA